MRFLGREILNFILNDRYQKTDTDTDISVKKPILTKPIPILNRYFGNFYYHGFWTNLYYCIGLFSTKTSRQASFLASTEVFYHFLARYNFIRIQLFPKRSHFDFLSIGQTTDTRKPIPIPIPIPKNLQVSADTDTKYRYRSFTTKKALILTQEGKEYLYSDVIRIHES